MKRFEGYNGMGLMNAIAELRDEAKREVADLDTRIHELDLRIAHLKGRVAALEYLYEYAREAECHDTD